jgi:hypothetical protein
LFLLSLLSLCQARPVHVAVSFLIGAWVVGVPLCYVLAFVVDMDLFGLWLGTMCSQIAVSAMTGFFVITSGMLSRKLGRISVYNVSHLCSCLIGSH